MKIYLVTGAAGFIGSHLCERIMEGGGYVIAVDDLSTGKIGNIEKFANKNYHFINVDITSSDFIGAVKIIAGKKLDGIFNFACPASPPAYQENPIKTMMTNVVGVRNTLSLARDFNCKILQASTSEIYGDPDVSPQNEWYHGNVNCFGPRACYDEGKRAAEALFFDYKKQYGVDIRIVRLFNTYGPRMQPDDGRVVSNFINQAIRNQPITVYGDGSQTRSFCYIDDTLDGIMAIWNAVYPCPVNVGNPQEYTMLQLAERIISLTRSKSEISFQTLPVDDPRQRKPDINLVKSLGWAGPKVSLDKGIRNTVQYYSGLMIRNSVHI